MIFMEDEENKILKEIIYKLVNNLSLNTEEEEEVEKIVKEGRYEGENC
jgi:hypothetical protein